MKKYKLLLEKALKTRKELKKKRKELIEKRLELLDISEIPDFVVNYEEFILASDMNRMIFLE
jgi:hypothetical protein